MPMHYTIDLAQRVVRITGSGKLTDAEMLACVSALRADPALARDMPTLSDMRDIEVAFTPEGVRQMIAIMRTAPTERALAKVAIVVGTDAAFGMGRMFELQADDSNDPDFRIFRDMALADAWLGLTPQSRDQRA